MWKAEKEWKQSQDQKEEKLKLGKSSEGRKGHETSYDARIHTHRLIAPLEKEEWPQKWTKRELWG